MHVADTSVRKSSSRHKRILLRSSQLYTALLHIYNSGLDDFVTPLQMLFEDVFDGVEGSQDVGRFMRFAAEGAEEGGRRAGWVRGRQEVRSVCEERKTRSEATKTATGARSCEERSDNINGQRAHGRPLLCDSLRSSMSLSRR